MHCQLVSNLHGQYFVMVRHHHWPPDIPRQPPVPIDDEWGARIFIRLLDVDARQWRHWVDSTQVDPRLDEIAFTAAAIRELARGQFSIYPIQQEAFLRTIPKACTFQNHRDPDDEQHEYAIIPPTVALVKPGYDPVPMLVARRLLQAWTATADIEQLKQMLTLLPLPHATTAPVAALIAALLDGLNAGGICLVRIRRRSTNAPAKKPEFLPFVHRPVPLAPPAQPAPIGAAPKPVSLYTPAMGQAGNANSAQKAPTAEEAWGRINDFIKNNPDAPVPVSAVDFKAILDADAALSAALKLDGLSYSEYIEHIQGAGADSMFFQDAYRDRRFNIAGHPTNGGVGVLGADINYYQVGMDTAAAGRSIGLLRGFVVGHNARDIRNGGGVRHNMRQMFSGQYWARVGYDHYSNSR